jgi:CelD/BcsL family acetyltransferase involved in cellulose biosynthesis
MTPLRSNLSIEVARTLQSVEALAADWAELEAKTPEATGFQSYEWCRSWIAASRAPADRFRVVTLREDGVLTMLWPLQVDKLLGARVLRWLGEPMTQYGDALALPRAERAHWRAEVEAEIARWRDINLVALTRLRADGVLAASGLAATPYGESLLAPFTDLRASGARRRRHKSIERRARRLAAVSELQLERAATPARRLDLAFRALALKRDWLRANGLFSTGLSNEVTSAFLDLLAQTDFVQIHALKLGANVSAIDVGFVRGGAYRSLMGCYDPRFAKGAPGHALTQRLMDFYAERGLAVYDFLAPDEPYKRAFADGATPLVAHLTARSLSGALAGFAMAWLRPAAKRLLAARADWTLTRWCKSFRKARVVSHEKSEGSGPWFCAGRKSF